MVNAETMRLLTYKKNMMETQMAELLEQAQLAGKVIEVMDEQEDILFAQELNEQQYNNIQKIFKLKTYLKTDFSKFERGMVFYIDNILFTVTGVRSGNSCMIYTVVCENGQRLELAYDDRKKTPLQLCAI